MSVPPFVVLEPDAWTRLKDQAAALWWGHTDGEELYFQDELIFSFTLTDLDDI